MLISLPEICNNYGFIPRIVLHIGAHEAEESVEYEKYEVKSVQWVEALPDKVVIIRNKLDPQIHFVTEGAAWNVSGEDLKLNVSNFSQASSLFDFDEKIKVFPTIKMDNVITVKSIAVDDLYSLTGLPDFINIDIQGAELQALTGAKKILSTAQVVYTEVSKKLIYREGTHIHELDEFLECFGFKRVTTRWILREGWGDALYLKPVDCDFTILQRYNQIVSRMKWDLSQLRYQIKLSAHNFRLTLKKLVSL